MLFDILLNALMIAQWIVLGQALMSWLINFQVLNIRQPMVYKVWSVLGRILNPIYDKIRRFLPSIQGVDLSPVILLIGIILLRNILISNQSLFY